MAGNLRKNKIAKRIMTISPCATVVSSQILDFATSFANHRDSEVDPKAERKNAIEECFNGLVLPDLSAEAAEIIDDCIEDGHDFQEISDFLCDGEALAYAGITDEDEGIVEEAYAFCQEVLKNFN